ncbi:MAG: hypothetical protein LBF89_00165 [Bacteroidales bacterium]|jgi:hypothetical protein|nr:hypothetical protein [Bacteroidales bacterium]
MDTEEYGQHREPQKRQTMYNLSGNIRNGSEVKLQQTDCNDVENTFKKNQFFIEIM